ncbi:beta-N-acetylhexosaminidase [Jiangella aurantiaca]|uniref:Beta-N-acetylhexosaminidase n=1 Tax=Jiangella aurantiaca TaxID=2530373 RepID=A0A4R5ALF5_9ACTN|nr:beta-N-acetylglucosaminidase domain-containing protein [Jiangella aurantiaca]TDD72329.1 beta-N-acetylhexosaminidase [Jiangella aurantiaca]
MGSVVVEAAVGCENAAAVLAGPPTLDGGEPVTVVVDVTPGGPAEGYRLVVDGGTVTITGSDPAGAFYGAQTLRALTADGVLPPVTVEDRPELPWRGTIEGFYGPPWSHADRLAHLEFAGRHKLNTYVYAPKDDPYHRKQWREPYPAAELDRIGELAAAAQCSHVRFVFSLSPGLTMVYSDPAELDLLIAKLEQVRRAGVQDFALLFDDIPLELEHDADRAAFGTAPGSSARAHAAVCHAVIERFLAPSGLDRPLIMVPTDYAGIDATPHRDLLAAELPPEVLVWWTGRDIVVGDITRAEIDAAARSYGHRLLLWDNFPVNDFDFPRLFLGPLHGRTTDLGGAPLAGITANPMPHEAASQIAVATVADWAWNPAAYDPVTAHGRALDAVGATEAVRTLARACASWPPSAPQDPELSALIDAALAGFAAAGEQLRDRFEAMVAAAPDGDREPADRLEREVMPWLVALADTGRAGLAALAALAPSAGAAERTAAAEALAVAEAHEQQNVLRTVVPPFVQAVLAR